MRMKREPEYSLLKTGRVRSRNLAMDPFECQEPRLMHAAEPKIIPPKTTVDKVAKALLGGAEPEPYARQIDWPADHTGSPAITGAAQNEVRALDDY